MGSRTRPWSTAGGPGELPGGPLIFAAADGMGGHLDGAQASKIAVQRLAEIVQGRTVNIEQLNAALEPAGQGHHDLGDVDTLSRPGTTVAGLALTEQDGEVCWLAFHVGDSRIYRWSEADGLEQIGSDHSVVQALVDAGAITEERALTHPQRRMITKAPGFGDRGGADYTFLPVVPGDRFLMCSDGLTGELLDGRIAVMTTDADEQALAEQLVAEAVQLGAQDNVSVVVAQV
ncbi:PP2C family protein-serine/threonine phosphatase [Petropleomorpha daqingensis]|nr:protein phosphatase 2C domain-containing protein [Petropleomorpha daqingensis]